MKEEIKLTGMGTTKGVIKIERHKFHLERD